MIDRLVVCSPFLMMHMFAKLDGCTCLVYNVRRVLVCVYINVFVYLGDSLA